MKKLLVGILCFCMLITVPVIGKSYALSSDMQAAWITTVYNQDWPKTKNNIAAQQKEMRDLLDTLKSTGVDTVMFQARTEGDALYKSSINPWSKVLTGTQGKDPGYDPLQYVINEAKARGMKVHVWLNPYRVTTSGTDYNALSANHPARVNQNWTLVHNGRIYYNPELPEVKKHIVDTVAEIVTNYDIDGIHFDDYFYPVDYPLPEGETKDGAVANARRNHINDMINQVRTKTKSIKSNVQFGLSPRGIWKNKSNDSLGSNTRGKESYYSDFADSRKWVKDNMVDYIVPQIYWEKGHSAADYETVLSWWADVAKGTNVKLYVGQGIYKDEVATEIDQQLAINDKYPTVAGSVYFSSIDILNNRKGAKDKIKAYNDKLKDIKGHWAETNIRDFVTKGHIDGYPDNTFKPDNSIKRSEFVKLVNKVFGFTEAGTENFNDVSEKDWFYNDVRIAVKAGYINGKSATKFDPEAYITREEVAKIVTTIMNKVDNDLDKLSGFADANTVSDWAKPYMEGAIEAGYISGYPGNIIKSMGRTSRAESVVVLGRIK